MSLTLCRGRQSTRAVPHHMSYATESSMTHRDKVIGALPVVGMGVHGQSVQLQDSALREEVGPNLHILHGPPKDHWQHWPKPDGLLHRSKPALKPRAYADLPHMHGNAAFLQSLRPSQPSCSHNEDCGASELCVQSATLITLTCGTMSGL